MNRINRRVKIIVLATAVLIAPTIISAQEYSVGIPAGKFWPTENPLDSHRFKDRTVVNSAEALRVCVRVGIRDQLKGNLELLGEELTYIKGEAAIHLSVRRLRHEV